MNTQLLSLLLFFILYYARCRQHTSTQTQTAKIQNVNTNLKKHRIAHTELPHNHEKAEFSSTWLTVVITEWCSTRHRYR